MSRFTESHNPFMNEDSYKKAATTNVNGQLIERSDQGVMTMNGAIDKTFMLIGLMMVTAFYSWNYPSMALLLTGAIGGIIVVIIAAFKKEMSGTLAPIYALLEGLFVGTISALYAAEFSGIVFQAVILTVSMLGLMLFLYKYRIIKVTEKLRSGIMMATGGVMLLYIISIGMSFFGVNMPYLHEGGMIGIGISLVIIGIAALNLLLDFDNFEKGVQYGAPKYMEWYSAMGLLVTLVWLYIEILRLLSKLNRD